MLAYPKNKVSLDLLTGEISKPVRSYDDFKAIIKSSKRELGSNDLLKQILRLLEIDILLKSIGMASASRNVTVSTTPVQIIAPERTQRGYIILNPSQSVGLTTSQTLFASATRTTAGSPYTSSNIGVANYLDSHLFLDISATVGTPTIQIDVYALDSLSGNYAITQSDIFTLPSAVGTYYGYIGRLGVGTDLRVIATLVGGTSSTFSLSCLNKEGVGGASTGLSQTAYLLGNSAVSTVNGFSLLEGQKETWFLRENASLWAVSGTSITLKIFELQ